VHGDTRRDHETEERHAVAATHPTTLVARLVPKAIPVGLEACDVEAMPVQFALAWPGVLHSTRQRSSPRF
jgi:hypothetical protein